MLPVNEMNQLYLMQNPDVRRNLPGIRFDELEDYAGKHDVTALRVYKAERLEHEVTFGAKPPQNWGRFAATYRDTPKEQGEAHD